MGRDNKAVGNPVDEGEKLQRGRLIFRKEERKALSKGWLYDVVKSKVDERRSHLIQIVQVLLWHGVGKMKTAGS